MKASVKFFITFMFKFAYLKQKVQNTVSASKFQISSDISRAYLSLKTTPLETVTHQYGPLVPAQPMSGKKECYFIRRTK